MEHIHTHHSDEQCTCGHNHESENNQTEESTLFENENSKISINHHEGATVCVAETNVFGKYDEIKSLLTSELDKFAEWINKKSGLIGHVKASVVEKSNCSLMSNTGGKTIVREYKTSRIDISITAIVFFIDDMLLCDRINQILECLN